MPAWNALQQESGGSRAPATATSGPGVGNAASYFNAGSFFSIIGANLQWKARPPTLLRNPRAGGWHGCLSVALVVGRPVCQGQSGESAILHGSGFGATMPATVIGRIPTSATTLSARIKIRICNNPAAVDCAGRSSVRINISRLLTNPKYWKLEILLPSSRSYLVLLVLDNCEHASQLTYPLPSGVGEIYSSKVFPLQV